MAIAPIALGDTSARAKINAAIEKANLVDGKADAAALGSETTARQADVMDLELRKATREAAADAQIGPGEYPTFWTVDVETAVSPTALPPSLAANDSDGRVIRVSAATKLGPIALVRIEPTRKYKARFAFRRRTNSPDPANDAVRLAVRWFDQSKTPLAEPAGTTIIQDVVTLTTGSGRQNVTVVFSREPGASVDLVAPAGTRYGRPFIQTFGLGSVTDIEVIDFVDITDASLWSPEVTDLDGRLAAVESVDAGSRLDYLESVASTPESMALANIGTLEASLIPASVQSVTLLSGAVDGDGLGGTYRRSVAPTLIQSLDGAYWVEINPLVKEPDEPTAIAGLDYRLPMTARRTKQSLDANAAPKVRALVGTDTVSRTLVEVSQDWVNIKEFGITYNGTDESAKVNAALANVNTNAKFRIIVEGEVKIASPVLMLSENLVIEGVSGWRSAFTSLLPNIKILVISGAKCRLENLATYYAVAPVAGALAVDWTGDEGKSRNITILNSYDGWRQAGHGHQSDNLQNFNYENTGITAAGAIGGWFSKFKLNAGSVARGLSGGIRLINQVESVNFQFGEVLSGKYSMTSAASAPELGQRPVANRFSTVFFDGAAEGSYLEYLYLTEFASCWFSGGREGDTAGVRLVSGNGVGYTGCEWVNCGRDGMLVGPSALNVSVHGGRAWDNGKTAPGSIGVNFNGTKYFGVHGLRGGNGIVSAYGPWPAGQQSYTVGVQAGCDHFLVQGVSDYANLNGAVYQGVAAGATEVYRDNF